MDSEPQASQNLGEEAQPVNGSIAKLLQTLKDANAVADPNPDSVDIPAAATATATTAATTTSVFPPPPPEESLMDAGDEADYESSGLESSDSDSDSDMDDSDYDAEGGEAGSRQRSLLRMIAEGGDDVDDPMGDAGTMVATRNEITSPVIPAVSITQLPDTAQLVELGAIHSIVDSSVIIEAHSSGESHVLDAESIVAFGDRRVLGSVFDVFGPISRPLYSVRFSSAEDIDSQKCAIGTRVYFSMPWSRMLATEKLRVKGTDASNEYDEEVGSDHMEFSDDEAELEHRKQRKRRIQQEQQSAQAAKQASQQADQKAIYESTGIASSNQTQLPPPQAGRKLQSYQDLYDPDLGF
ncbi:hypothetical protein GGI12_003118 [Dipsacomyces acuminosporus]|nr:hypothetical protein GGI12_003118 [Dipsacomyces acuminosporus]